MKRIPRIDAVLQRSMQEPETQTLIYLPLAVARLKGAVPGACGAVHRAQAPGRKMCICSMDSRPKVF